jgi:signal transduction histidine kinase
VLLSETLHSSTLRLALIYIAVFCTAILAVLGYVRWITACYLSQELESSFGSERLSLIESYNKYGRSGVAALINERTQDPEFKNWAYVLVDASCAKIAGNLPGWPEELQGTDGSAHLNLSDAPLGWPQPSSVRAVYATLPDGSRYFVGRSVADIEALRGRITIALAIAATLFLILAAAAGISTSRRSVARIEAINKTSRQIMQSGLDKRTPLRGTRDEWDGLAANLNSMLDRIQALAEWNRRVSDNIAHDLRTPLTRLRGRLERACSQEPDLFGYRGLVADTLGELDEILKTFSSLLRISQIENRDRTAAFCQVDLTEIAREVVDLFDPTAEEQKIRLRFCASEPQPVCGDRDLLFDAISNLVDNAIKHGGQRGEVRVAVDRGSGGPVLSIADRGPGIPSEERKKVMQRFYRLEGSRNSPGNGLGLSLVAAVADLHDAEIIMTDNAPGLSVELHFPTPRAETPSDLYHSRESGHPTVGVILPHRPR